AARAVEGAPLAERGADLLQLGLPPGSRLHGVYIDELRLPPQAVVSLLVRAGQALVPGSDTRLMRGDQLLVVTGVRQRDAVERRVGAGSRGGRRAPGGGGGRGRPGWAAPPRGRGFGVGAVAWRGPAR